MIRRESRSAICSVTQVGFLGSHLPFVGEDEHRPGDVAAAFSRCRLVHRPGERFGYSNGGYVLAGALLEEITGQPFPELLRSFTQTLGMAQTRTLPGCRSI